MGNITENPVWENNVLQIEVGNSVGGGSSAVVNLQAQDLANRTQYLKAKVDSLQTALDGKAATSHTHSYAPIPTSSSYPVEFATLVRVSASITVANNSTTAGSNLAATHYQGGWKTGSSLSGTWKNISGSSLGQYDLGLFVRTA